jgi:hypothetical protein
MVENICKLYSAQGLISGIYRKLQKLNAKNNTVKNGQQIEINIRRHANGLVAWWYMKNISSNSSNRSIIQRFKKSAGKVVEKRESLDALVGNVNLYGYYGKQYEVSLKTRTII